MNCQGVVLEVSNYIDGELDAILRVEFEQHLEICKHCYMIVSQTKQTIEVFCQDEPIELPEDVKGRLRDVLRRKLGGTQS